MYDQSILYYTKKKAVLNWVEQSYNWIFYNHTAIDYIAANVGLDPDQARNIISEFVANGWLIASTFGGGVVVDVAPVWVRP